MGFRRISHHNFVQLVFANDGRGVGGCPRNKIEAGLDMSLCPASNKKPEWDVTEYFGLIKESEDSVDVLLRLTFVRGVDDESSGASMTNTNFSGTIILLSSSTRGSCTRCRHWLLDRFISNVQVGIYIIADTTLHTWKVFHEATAESSEKILGGFLVIFILVKEETASQDHVFIQWLWAGMVD